MKRTLLALVGAAALASAGLAQANETPKPPATGAGFVGLQLGNTAWSTNDNFDDSDSDTSYAARGGYRWNVGAGNAIGIEAGYADFGRVNRYGSIVVPGAYANIMVNYTGHVDATAVLLGANYQLTFGGGKGFFDARLGAMRLTLKATANAAGYGSATDSETDSGAYVGVGVGYYFTPHFGLGLNYDFHRATVQDNDANFASSSVGAVFRF